MSEKIKVVNNVNSAVGFNLSPSNDAFRLLSKQGSFFLITEDELNFIFVNQEIIQKGILWVDNKEKRVELGLEEKDGKKLNQNIVQYEEIVELVKGHHKTLESALKRINEPTILTQFVDVARELEVDSIAKIRMIENKSKQTIYDED